MVMLACLVSKKTMVRDLNVRMSQGEEHALAILVPSFPTWMRTSSCSSLTGSRQCCCLVYEDGTRPVSVKPRCTRGRLRLELISSSTSRRRPASSRTRNSTSSVSTPWELGCVIHKSVEELRPRRLVGWEVLRHDALGLSHDIGLIFCHGRYHAYASFLAFVSVAVAMCNIF